MAALYYKLPFLVLQKDKVALQPNLFLLPKVQSSFHINENVIVPPSIPILYILSKKIALHNLNVVKAIKIYLN